MAICQKILARNGYLPDMAILCIIYFYICLYIFLYVVHGPASSQCRRAMWIVAAAWCPRPSLMTSLMSLKLPVSPLNIIIYKLIIKKHKLFIKLLKIIIKNHRIFVKTHKIFINNHNIFIKSHKIFIKNHKIFVKNHEKIKKNRITLTSANFYNFSGA